MKKYKNLLFLIYGILFMVIGFKAEKPVLALIIGGVPILLFVIFTLTDIKKKNAIQQTSNNNKSNQPTIPVVDTKGKRMPKNEKLIDKIHIRYIFEQNFHAHNQRMKQQAHKYPLVVGAEFLFRKGFVFCRAIADGGINEIGHTGDKAYYAEYIDFIDFRDNFEKHMDEAEKFEVENSGGWISSINYGYIDIFLKSNEMRVSISVDRATVRVNWYDVLDENAPIFDELNKKLLEVLGEGVKYGKEPCYNLQLSDESEKKYLSNWEIHHKIEYWLNDDTGGVVREISPFEFEYLRKGETEWTKLQPDNSFEREVYLGQGNNCLTKITPEEAETIIKKWYSDIKIDTITVIK